MFEANIKGIAEVKRAIYAYNAKLGERVSRVALRAGANAMLKQIRNAAPVKTGRLKRAIRVKNSKIHTIRRNGSVGVYITVQPGKNRRDPRGAYYAKWVETGYQRGSQRTGKRGRTGGVRVEGKHFVLNTFNATKDNAARLIIQASEIAAERVAKELHLK